MLRNQQKWGVVRPGNTAALGWFSSYGFSAKVGAANGPLGVKLTRIVTIASYSVIKDDPS